jgi:hypothetical protein
MAEATIQGRPLRPDHGHLTPLYPFDVECQIDITMAGMAHFAGTGPSGRTCGVCRHYGYDRKHYRQDDGEWLERCNGCAMYKQLTGTYGPAVPPQTPSCRHFVPR